MKTKKILAMMRSFLGAGSIGLFLIGLVASTAFASGVTLNLDGSANLEAVSNYLSGGHGGNASAPRAAGPISFYGDMGNIISSHNPLLVRPSTILLAEDGSVALVHLRWSGWGTRVARATGVWSASSCTPNCATGKRMKSPARVTLSNPGRVLGHTVYRCFQLTPPHPKRDAWSARECIQRQGGIYAYAPVSLP